MLHTKFHQNQPSVSWNFLNGFTIYKHDKCLGLVAGIMLTNSHFIVPKAYFEKVPKNWYGGK